MTSQFYNNNAIALSQQYLSKSFDEVHASWSKFLPAILQQPNARILDIGAGTERDVKHLHTHQANNTKNNVQIMVVEINAAVERVELTVVCLLITLRIFPNIRH